MVGFARIMGPVIIVNVHQDTMETIARKVSVVSIGWYGKMADVVVVLPLTAELRMRLQV
jgi:hypothetical protein